MGTSGQRDLSDLVSDRSQHGGPTILRLRLNFLSSWEDEGLELTLRRLERNKNWFYLVDLDLGPGMYSCCIDVPILSEEIGSEMSSHRPPVTQQVRGKSGIWNKACG